MRKWRNWNEVCRLTRAAGLHFCKTTPKCNRFPKAQVEENGFRRNVVAGANSRVSSVQALPQPVSIPPSRRLGAEKGGRQGGQTGGECTQHHAYHNKHGVTRKVEQLGHPARQQVGIGCIFEQDVGKPKKGYSQKSGQKSPSGALVYHQGNQEGDDDHRPPRQKGFCHGREQCGQDYG
jgi:hypothetical protein